MQREREREIQKNTTTGGRSQLERSECEPRSDLRVRHYMTGGQGQHRAPDKLVWPLASGGQGVALTRAAAGVVGRRVRVLALLQRSPDGWQLEEGVSRRFARLVRHVMGDKMRTKGSLVSRQ